MTDRELMQQARDALVYLWDGCPTDKALVERLDDRLAQPEPEPVAWMYQHEDTGLTMCVIVQQVGAGFEKNNPRWQKIAPLFTAPPQREWQGLTDEEIKNHWLIAMQSVEGTFLPIPEFARAIEAKLKEKNNG